MKPTIDEIQLTAYALGEGSASQRRQIEAQLQTDPAAQATVAQIRALAAQLETDLRHEPDIALTDAQRQAIFQAPAQPAGRLVRFPWRKLTGFAAVAAVITLVFAGAFWGSSSSLTGPIQLSENEHGQMLTDNPDIPREVMLDVLSSPEELAERVDTISLPAVDMSMPPPPEIQDFAAAPKVDQVVELEIASSAVSPLVMKKVAPGAMANRSGARMEGYVARARAPYPISEPLPNTESYAPIQGNSFKRVADEPLSTFSIDVDTAAYANVRRFLRSGEMPPADAVRIEEMINYFSYDYAPPKEDVPFAVHVESAACPWNPAHPLVKIGLKGRELAAESRPPCNLAFLIDVSGSMGTDNKLPLVKKSLQLLARQLSPADRVSIVVYASSSGVVLPSTSCDNLPAIDAAIERLQSGGSTAGGAGIRLAYDEALKSFQPDGNNRVILCTDGDFNVGITDSGELAAFIAERAKQGIFLTVLGFGMRNYKDDRLETLADKGNGNYAYIDSFSEARKSLVEQAAGTLFAIAKDVKLQIEFNPAHFSSYRLLGYENRILAKEDFNDDQKDAGELGAGHTVTAFYELVPVGAESAPGVDPLKYQASDEAPAAPTPAPATASPEWLTVKLRYKLPREDRSSKIEVPFTGSATAFENASADFRFAASVAAAGFLLRQDPAAHALTYRQVIDWTAAATGADPDGYRREFLDLLRNAASLAP